MKWGGRKHSSSSSSSSSSSFISHASPFSWLSKLKHMRIKLEATAGKMKHKAKQSGSPQYSCEYGDFSRQPFNEESYKDKRIKILMIMSFPPQPQVALVLEGMLRNMEREKAHSS